MSEVFCPATSPIALSPHNFTILLVDDDPIIRDLVKMKLDGLGYEVIQTENGEDALALVESNPFRPIHLLITDMVMPRIGGNELASRLQAIYPQMRVLLCSGHLKEHVVQEQREGTQFLQKPFTTTDLLEKVTAVLK
jgi:DNA-binding NtrC family response regulator